MRDLSENAPEDRITALDGFRGFAILIVTIYRFGSVGYTENAFGGWVKAFHIGATGVDFFFVLSGFLITGILLKSKGKSRGYFLRFYARRTLRIFPLYYLTLVLFLLLLPVFGVSTIRDNLETSSISLWTYTMNLVVFWRDAWSFGAFNHYWSLAIEEQYYLVWPLIVYWLSNRRLKQLCLISFVLLATVRVGFSILELGSVSEKSFTLFRLDGLLLGSWLSVMFLEKRFETIRLRDYRILCLGTMLLYVLALPLGAGDYTIRYSLISMAATTMLLCTVVSPEQSVERIVFENRWLRSLGKVSYAMYLFQGPLIPLAEPYFQPNTLQPWLGRLASPGVYTAAMFLATYLLAQISWYTWEVHFLNARKYFHEDHRVSFKTRSGMQSEASSSDDQPLRETEYDKVVS